MDFPQFHPEQLLPFSPILTEELIKMLEREWFFYIIRCRDNSLYTGITTNIEARLKAHNRGTGAKYTAGRRPLSLVYLETCADESQARKREAQVKRWTKAQKERLIAARA